MKQEWTLSYIAEVISGDFYYIIEASLGQIDLILTWNIIQNNDHDKYDCNKPDYGKNF